MVINDFMKNGKYENTSIWDRDAFEQANTSLNMNAIILNTEKPFLWASGYYMPIYNDNRQLLRNPQARNRIISYLTSLAESIDESSIIVSYDMIAGVATSGIPWATSLADEHKMPLIYVREKPKDHGLRNRIEGIPGDQDLKGKKILLIEDLVSTGRSSVDAVQAIRDANGKVDLCLSIFSYDLKPAREMFAGERPYDKEGTKRLTKSCTLRSILGYDTLIGVAFSLGKITSQDYKMLKEWREDPFNWGEKHGFPPVKK